MQKQSNEVLETVDVDDDLFLNELDSGTLDFPIDGLDFGHVISIEQRIIQQVTVLDPDDLILEIDDKGTQENADCCKTNSGLADAKVLRQSFVKDGFSVTYSGSHPCGIKYLGMYFADVVYQDIKGKDGKPDIRIRRLKPINESGAGKPYDCSTKQVSAKLTSTIKFADLKALNLYNRNIAIVVAAVSCCYKQGQKAGFRKISTKDFSFA